MNDDAVHDGSVRGGVGHDVPQLEGDEKLSGQAQYIADLITLDLTSPRLETAEPDTMLESVVFAATAADVINTVVGC